MPFSVNFAVSAIVFTAATGNLPAAVSPETELEKALPGIFERSAAHYKAIDAKATPLMKNAKGEDM